MNSNASLRTIVLKAKAAQMTNDAIDRAVKRGAGLTDAGAYEAFTYEGYGPGGVAMLIDVLTDNRNRTASDVRNIFSKMGGSLAEPGAVSYQFERRGLLVVHSLDEDLVMLSAIDAGATDVVADGDGAWLITCDPSAVFDVRDALQAAGIEVVSSESTMVSNITIEITDSADARAILRIMDALDELDDVQDVYSNFDISESLMELVGE